MVKVEEDGRVFPTTDNSESIIRCLLQEAAQKKIEIVLEQGITGIERLSGGGFFIDSSNGSTFECDRLLIATGGVSKIHPQLEKLGHTIVPPVPSLFTFNLPESPFLDLSGISLPSVQITLPQFALKETGALLFTHWGLSRPAVLKLSAWAARDLHTVDYQTEVLVNWLPEKGEEELRNLLIKTKSIHAACLIGKEPPFPLPNQLWKRLSLLAGCQEEERWSSFYFQTDA